MSTTKDDPNATCAFWDEEAAQWSSEGVETLLKAPCCRDIGVTFVGCLDRFGFCLEWFFDKHILLILSCVFLGHGDQ